RADDPAIDALADFPSAKRGDCLQLGEGERSRLRWHCGWFLKRKARYHALLPQSRYYLSVHRSRKSQMPTNRCLRCWALSRGGAPPQPGLLAFQTRAKATVP